MFNVKRGKNKILKAFEFAHDVFLIFFLIHYSYVDTKRIISNKKAGSDLKSINGYEYLLGLPKYRQTLDLRNQGKKEKSITPEDHLVTNLPELNNDDFKTKQYAGLLEIDPNNTGNIFYWLFEADENPETAPILIWLNGGPGCSSMDGLFLEAGPFHVKNGSLSINKFSWHKKANLLFVDQPFGTGFSFVKNGAYPRSVYRAGELFHKFLLNFLRIHKNFVHEDKTDTSGSRSRDIYMFGESYAGRYIPDIAEHISNANKVNDRKDPKIILIGMGLGNAWVHPPIQYDYSDYAHGVGLITYGQMKSLKQDFKKCLDALAKGEYRTRLCLNNMDSIVDSASKSDGLTLNYYDVTKYVKNPSSDYPPGRLDVESYLNRVDVREAIHVKSSPKYKECRDEIYNALSHEDGKSSLNQVSQALQNNIRVLFFNGQWDLMCNTLGTESLLLELKWDGLHEYLQAKKYTWTHHSFEKPFGYAQQGGGLTFLNVIGSSHMVPMDAPAASFDMISRFIENRKFDGNEQQVKVAAVSTSEEVYCPDDYVSEINLPKTSWFWICFVVSLVSIISSSIVTIFCLRNPNNRSMDHTLILEDEKEDDDDDEFGDDGIQMMKIQSSSEAV